MKLSLIRMVLILVATLMVLPVLAQQRYELSGEQELAVLGSSTLHNWEMVTYTASGEGMFTLSDEGITAVEGLSISFEATSLESGRGRIMDRNARRALKAEEHPLITFELLKFWVDEEDQHWASGHLNAAGEQRRLDFKVEYTMAESGIELRARSSFKLTDFKIEPPVALAGTLRTGDAVSVDVFLSFKEKNQGSGEK